MSEPEIARRCSSCGASIRVRAFFCPQCGTEVKPKSDQAAITQDDEVGSDPPTPEMLAETVDLSIGKQSSEQAATAPISAAVPLPPTQPLRQESDPSKRIVKTPREGPVDAHGVERWVQISTAVLDEASYDPSLRFVLVAALLFFLFVVIVIMSELIT